MKNLSPRNSALLALTAAGVLWGLTVPLSKIALHWLDPAWLTVARFAIAAPLLALVARKQLAQAFTPAILASGALGYGAVVVIQNTGIERTSVSHAALIVGAVPALVALFTTLAGRGSTGRAAWLGFGLALAGVGLVAGGGGGDVSGVGDALVLASVAMSAAYVSVQPRLLENRDPMAVTAVQFAAGGVAALPAAFLEGMPAAPGATSAWVSMLVLATAGTLLPFSLFAYGQSRVVPELAGVFMNLEPLVGALAGTVVFGDVFGGAQILGAAVLLIGIVLSARPRSSVGLPV